MKILKSSLPHRLPGQANVSDVGSSDPGWPTFWVTVAAFVGFMIFTPPLLLLAYIEHQQRRRRSRRSLDLEMVHIRNEATIAAILEATRLRTNDNDVLDNGVEESVISGPWATSAARLVSSPAISLIPETNVDGIVQEIPADNDTVVRKARRIDMALSPTERKPNELTTDAQLTHDVISSNGQGRQKSGTVDALSDEKAHCDPTVSILDALDRRAATCPIAAVNSVAKLDDSRAHELMADVDVRETMACEEDSADDVSNGSDGQT